MATINKLSAVDSLSVSDLLAVFDASNGDTRKASISALTTYLEANLTFPNNTYVRQSVTGTATAFSVAATDSGSWGWMFITQGANYAAGTVVFPASPVNQQELLIQSNYAVTTLTEDDNGKTIVGGAGTIVADTVYRYKYDSTNETWYRIGV